MFCAQFDKVRIKRGLALVRAAAVSLTRHHLVLVVMNNNITSTTPTTMLPSDANLDREELEHEQRVIRLVFSVELDATEFFTNLQKLINTAAIEQLYAFYYTPKTEAEIREKEYGWKSYDPEAEFKRMGLGPTNGAWRVTTINKDFSFCPTYPKLIAVPARISDNVLKHGGKFKSKSRIPA
ncbi:hypothetical protein HK100_010763, partial [Physocladia obscura]